MKIIKVKKCLKCPYFRAIYNFQCGFNGREIKDPYKNDIPDWCELQDLEINSKGRILKHKTPLNKFRFFKCN